jgi:UTP--glucose-1-phosphate uridylyltransferase
VQKISGLARFSYVRQPKPLGDGHAILCARHLVGEDEAVAVLFGDDLVDSEVPVIKQLIDVYEKYHDPVIALNQVPMDEVHKFGVVDAVKIDDRTFEIKNFVEKPKTEDAPSNLAVVGKYIITPEIFEKLEESRNDEGEIRLANAFIKMLKENRPLYGHEFTGERHDCGDKFGFVKATIKLGMKHPEIGEKLKEFLKELR